MKLPNAHLAVVEREKVTEYLLNPVHRFGAVGQQGSILWRGFAHKILCLPTCHYRGSGNPWRKTATTPPGYPLSRV